MFIICQFIYILIIKVLGYKKGLCPVSEDIYERIITLPIFPILKDEEVEFDYNKIICVLNSDI